jgi:DNA-binding IclR family transcriptional regulator
LERTSKPRPRLGVIAVDRALGLLDVFTDHDRSLTLSELARRSGLDKATILRLAASLQKAGLLVRGNDASWRLGPKLARLGMMYQTTFQVRDLVEPALARLAQITGESATLHVREGDHRICLYRVDSIQSVRHHTRVGDMLPLDRGAPGRVMLAFANADGQPYDEIRRRFFHVTMGERDPQVGSIACAVFKADQVLFGTIGVTGPVTRFTQKVIQRHLEQVKLIADELTRQLGGTPVFQTRPGRPPTIDKKTTGAKPRARKGTSAKPPGGNENEDDHIRSSGARGADGARPA